MMRSSLVLLIALTLPACSEPLTDRDPTDVAVSAMSEWMDTVGVMRRDMSFAVVPDSERPADSELQGQAWCGSPARFALYQGSFRADVFEANVRHVVLHELVHIHTGCRPHSSDPAALMYRELTDENLNAGVDPADAALIREAWLR